MGFCFLANWLEEFLFKTGFRRNRTPRKVNLSNAYIGFLHLIGDSFGGGIYSVKQSYDVDECYEQDVGTEEIFSREIKPLIPGLFGGQNITVFAYGPRNSGKTYTIQVGTLHFPLIWFY